MEFQKIVIFLDTTSDDTDLPRFVTKRWIEVYDQSEENYNVNKEIRIKKSMLKLDLCDYSDAYIVLKGTITVVIQNNARKNKAVAFKNNAPFGTITVVIQNNARKNKAVAFKNNAPFINCISKINGAKIDNAEDSDVVMPMYNLLEYSKNYK